MDHGQGQCCVSAGNGDVTRRRERERSSGHGSERGSGIGRRTKDSPDFDAPSHMVLCCTHPTPSTHGWAVLNIYVWSLGLSLCHRLTDTHPPKGKGEGESEGGGGGDRKKGKERAINPFLYMQSRREGARETGTTIHTTFRLISPPPSIHFFSFFFFHQSIIPIPALPHTLTHTSHTVCISYPRTYQLHHSPRHPLCTINHH